MGDRHNEFLEMDEAGKDGEAMVSVHRPGNYSYSYRTHTAGDPSESSATVTIEELGEWCPPSAENLCHECQRKGEGRSTPHPALSLQRPL
jgi:hypothetical protein